MNIKEISLHDFFAKIVIHPGGVTNIQHIFGEAKGNAAARRRRKTADERPHLQNPGPPDANRPRPPDIKIPAESAFGAPWICRPQHPAELRGDHAQSPGSVTGPFPRRSRARESGLEGNLGYRPRRWKSQVRSAHWPRSALPINSASKILKWAVTATSREKWARHQRQAQFQRRLPRRSKLAARKQNLFRQLTFGDKVESGPSKRAGAAGRFAVDGLAGEISLEHSPVRKPR